MLAYCRSIWKYRFFWGSLVRMDIRTRYRGSWLGAGWSLLHPLAMSAVMCVVLHRLFGIDVAVYLPSVLAGFVVWQFGTACTITGCNSLVAGEAYIRQFPAPMGIYPLRTTLAASFHLMIALAVVTVGNGFLNGFHPGSVVTALPSLPMLLVFGWSVGVLAGFANVYFPDVQHLTEVSLQLLFYMTPIMYPPELLQKRGVGWLLNYNPVAALIETVRAPILGQGPPPLATYATAMGLVLFTFTAAALTLKRFERRVIFQL